MSTLASGNIANSQGFRAFFEPFAEQELIELDIRYDEW
jgi:hypothetical protein